jgi:hypothetical protein
MKEGQNEQVREKTELEKKGGSTSSVGNEVSMMNDECL